MGMYFTTTSKTLSASDKIARDAEEFLSRGKEIEQIPTGQSAYNLELRAVESRGRGTRRAWKDGSLSLKSEQGKRLSVAKIEAKKAREKGRKR